MQFDFAEPTLLDIATQYRDAQLSIVGCDNKTAVTKWTRYKTRLPDDDALSLMFTKKAAPQIAVICGGVSGGLEVIDVDTKNDPTNTLWDNLFNDLLDYFNSNMPLLITKTVNGGMHIYYRCETIEGNQKLASRKEGNQLLTVIETRGEGGYVVAPPSPGYSLLDHKKLTDHIPVISIETRNDILDICRKYNEVFKEEVKKSGSSSGGKNTPWDAYNNDEAWRDVLQLKGWSLTDENSEREYWKRPGSDNKWSATWHKEKRLFYVFTTSSEFESERPYSPSAIFAILQCNGDFSKAGKQLRARGYGQPEDKASEKGEKRALPENIFIPHSEILVQLIDQLGPVNFKSLVYGGADKMSERLRKLDVDSEEAKECISALEKMKLGRKHYLVLSIEHVLQIAKTNQWDLCKNLSFIYLYNGAYWSVIDKDAFQKFLGEAAEKMGVEMFDAKHYQFREQLFKQFLATAYLPTPDPPKDRVYINLQNGTYEISSKGMRLRAFNPLDFVTYQLPFEFNADAKAPIFQAFLDRVLPDKERQKVLAEYLGYVFIKNGSNALKEEKALILYGAGANGKSVVFEIVVALFGKENVSSYSLQDITNDLGYHRAALANKLLNYASEINGKVETSIFKQLVSGEPVGVRLPYVDPFIMYQYAKLMFNCNELPKDVEHMKAYFRRFLIIPFDVTIPENEQDKQLHVKIIEGELSGVFNWVLEGLNRLLSQKRFSVCEAATRAVQQYELQSDTARIFLEDAGYQSSPTYYKTLKDIYTEYRNYCLDDGYKPLNKTNFRKRLEAAGFVFEKKNIGNVFYIFKESEPF